MTVAGYGLRRREPLLLLLGDLFFFVVCLWLSLFLRNFSVPTREFFGIHLEAYSILFVVWVAAFYIAGLYGRHTTILRRKLPTILLNTLIFNSLIAVLFFYFIPFFGIAPKTVLFIDLVVSFLAILLWRMYGYFYLVKSKAENAIIIGSGDELRELVDEVNSNNIYDIRFVSSGDLQRSKEQNFVSDLIQEIETKHVSVIVMDIRSPLAAPILPHLYNLIFSNVTFLDMNELYETIFDRVPLSLINYDWFLENISIQPKPTYDALKRVMDIILSFTLGCISLIVYPFVYLAIKLDDFGPIFITQERVGQDGITVKIHKFRSMTRNDEGLYGETKPGNKVTRVGSFLRKSRIDELPQLWDVLMGKISLIGPRPELPALVNLYEKEIPYYNIRNLLKPGLSGWAQIHQENHPHHKEAVNETREKLTYDLYYIKERSLLLDLQISLRTVKTILSRAGR